MKIARIIIFLLLSLLMTACQWNSFTADTLPWVGEEPVLFKDNFSDRNGNWTTHADSLSFSGYDQGGFRLWADVPNYQFWSVPELNFKDVLIYTSARKQSGPENNIFGVLCRYQDEENFYAFVVGSDGYYGIFRTLAGEQVLIDQQHLDFNEVIKGGEAVNEIQAICQGDLLTLLVNGNNLLQVKDQALSYGDVGLIVGNFSEPGVDIIFDNFIVVKP